jgi:hypothetical protein
MSDTYHELNIRSFAKYTGAVVRLILGRRANPFNIRLLCIAGTRRRQANGSIELHERRLIFGQNPEAQAHQAPLFVLCMNPKRRRA